MLPVLACSAVLLAGCGGETYPLAPVAGTVKLKGKPLADARVGFEPIRKGERLNAGPGSYGKTDANGRFELTSLDGDPGAVVGMHRVWITTHQAEEGPYGSIVTVVEEKLPPKYNVETELTFEVKEGGTDAANFDLSSP